MKHVNGRITNGAVVIVAAGFAAATFALALPNVIEADSQSSQKLLRAGDSVDLGSTANAGFATIVFDLIHPGKGHEAENRYPSYDSHSEPMAAPDIRKSLLQLADVNRVRDDRRHRHRGMDTIVRWRIYGHGRSN